MRVKKPIGEGWKEKKVRQRLQDMGQWQQTDESGQLVRR